MIPLTVEKNDNAPPLSPYGINDEKVLDGDELSITVYSSKHPEQVRGIETINERSGFPITEGCICLPYLSTIDVSGLTLNEVRDQIQLAYIEEIPDANIYIHFKKRRDRIVQIIGASTPIVSVNEHTRLSEVIAKAKLSPYANLFKSYVMRNEEKIPVDLYQLIHKGDQSQNMIMQGGDQIFIANITDANVMITGEVRYPGTIAIPYGFISLPEAIARVGGIPFTGNQNSLYVIRGALERPKIYSLGWREILSFSHDSLLLIPGDVVIVSEQPLTQWNRFIDQLQPSAGSMQTTCNLYGIIQSAD